MVGNYLEENLEICLKIKKENKNYYINLKKQKYVFLQYINS